jgi:hypothetical protein
VIRYHYDLGIRQQLNIILIIPSEYLYSVERC